MRLINLKSLLFTLFAFALVGTAFATQLTNTIIGTNPGPTTASYDSSTGAYAISIDGTSTETANYRDFYYAQISGNFSVTTQVTGLPAAASGQTLKASGKKPTPPA